MTVPRLLATAAVACSLLASGAAAARAAEGDIALVIGNNDYDNAPDAATGRRDAELVADTLAEAGYEVVAGFDLDRAEMRETITRFARLVAVDANRVVIFYSGHAIRAGGVSYLAPVDASAATLTDVLFDGVPLDLLLGLAAEAPDSAVVFVDAAQLAGFTPQTFAEPGLAAIEPPPGVLVVSAAPPGRAIRRSRHRDSRFAILIAERFLSPGATVEEALDAAGRPTWSAGSTGAELVLVDTPEAVLENDADLALQIELAFWRSAERSGRAEDYRAYLERYPNGTFAPMARNRIGAAAAPTPTPQPQGDPDEAAEAALSLDRAERRRVQVWLTATGFDTRGADGLFGRNTRDALRRWQRANGFRGTGYLTAAQLALIARQGQQAVAEEERREQERARAREARDNAFWADTGANGTRAGLEAYLATYPSGLHAQAARTALDRIASAEAAASAEEIARREDRTWRRTSRRDTAEAYRDFLAEFPEGRHANEALARLDEIEGAERQDAASKRAARIEAALELGPYDLLSLEQRLAFLGFSPGAQDGTLDNSAREAIAAYQSSRQLEVTGYFDRPTVVGIVQETGGPGRGGGIDGAAVLRGLLDAITRQ